MKKTIIFVLCSILILNIGLLDTSAALETKEVTSILVSSAYYDLKNMERETGINVIEELNKMKSDFLMELQSEETTSERKDQIQAQIDGIDENIKLINQLKALEKGGKSLDNSNDINSIIIPPADPCAGDIVAMSAIVAWFNNRNYKLSAELLSYSFVNTHLYSIYTPNPNNTSKIKNTSWFQTTKSKTQAGSDEFYSGDLYYAIHFFDYYFGYDFGIKYMVISDPYDYAPGHSTYPAAAWAATNAMYVAQLKGCLVPFTTTIYLNTQ